MKTSVLILTFFLSLSCKAQTTGNSTDNKVKVIAKHNYQNYIFYTTLNKRDTVLVVAPKGLLKNCDKSTIFTLNLKGAKKVKALKTKTDSIYFQYSIEDVNSQYEIKTGQGKPGPEQKGRTYIDSYTSYPYYVESCEALK